MTMTIATIETQCEYDGVFSYKPLVWCTSPREYTSKMETETVCLFEFLRNQLGIMPNDETLIFCLYEANPDHTDRPVLHSVCPIIKESKLCLS